MKRTLTVLGFVACGVVAQAQVLYSTNFDSFTLGSVLGQDGWVEDTVGGYAPAQIVNDPTSSGRGRVLDIDPATVNDSGWLGVYRALSSAVTTGIVEVSWKQYRENFGDNLWFADNPDFANWWGLQWDSDNKLHATSNFGNPSTLTAASTWVDVKFRIDVTAKTVEGFLGNVSYGTGAWTGASSFRGLALELSSTAAQGGDNDGVLIDDVRIAAVPEPGTMAVLGLGALALARRRRNR